MFKLRTHDNTETAVSMYNPNGKEVVILIHGWPLNSRMFEYQIPALLDQGYCVISPDLRGFGESEFRYYYNDLKRYYDDCAKDIANIFVNLKLGKHKVHLLGFSMGGAIVARFASLYSTAHLESVCFLDAALPSYCKTDHFSKGNDVASTQGLIDLGYKDRPALNKYFGDMFFAQSKSDEFKSYFLNLCNSADGVAEMFALEALKEEDLYNELPNIKCRTAIFHGENDKICSVEGAKIVNKLIPNSELFLYDMAGHGMFHDQMVDFNRDLIDFLNGE